MKSLKLLVAFVFLFVATQTLYAQKAPSFEDIISLSSVSNPKISPDGKHVVFQRRSVDWGKNRFDTELWLSKNGGTPFQLTNSPNGSNTSPQWSPDGKWISFMANTTGSSQVHVISVNGGAMFQATHSKRSVFGYEWSPDSQQIAFLQTVDGSKEDKAREKKYGAFAVEDKEFNSTELWVSDFDPELLNYKPLPGDTVYSEKIKPRLLVNANEFTVTSFIWSPDGKKIAFGHAPEPGINSFFNADISIYDVESETHSVLVQNNSFDGIQIFSPDSKSLLYSTHLDNRTSNYYLNNNLFRIDLDGTNNVQLAADFDENINWLDWKPTGIFGVAWQKTNRHLVRIDPQSGETTILSETPARITSLSMSADGKSYAFTGNTNNDLTEVYTGTYPNTGSATLTNSSDQIDGWMVSNSEVISWKSKDGAIIEGVLHKPMDYDPNKKYPLLVSIHGGPTGISTPSPTPAYVYPIVQWLNKGALVLQPNYRGSAGYGEDFRKLNVRNLGVGDAWDVISGVEYLEKEGIIDGDKVGSMGWSQGGYISAFLTTNSKKFKAISVGAGISDWETYYVSTDIHPFTRQYLKGTPWSDEKIYKKTSPMTNINKAVTPTLIQHGEFDRRVPVSNAYELFQGLQDVGVDTELIIYKGFGHGITKPKERLAAMWHNWQWFGKYIWGEDIELPKE